MDEFALIRRHFAPLAPVGPGVILGIGDDCALLEAPPGHVLAVTTDTLVAGRHFPFSTAPYDVGWKSLAVNLSDLAAMGAEPRWFTLALTAPEPDPSFLEGFSRGLGTLAREHAIALVGGDTTRGPLSITITAMGTVPHGAALRRDGARPGDLVCVTGTLGDAALGLRLAQDRSGFPADADARAALVARLDRPSPRVAAGLALRGIAHAAIDLSDGLAGDLRHVASAGGVDATIDAERLPRSDAFSRICPPGDRLALQAGGGDDYELCVCVAPEDLEEARRRLDVPLTPVGRIVARAGQGAGAVTFLDASGATMDVQPHGFRHFE